MNSHQIVRIINHVIIFLSFTFSISIKLVLWIWRVDFSKCSENHIKKQRDGVYIFLRRRSEELIRLFRIFMEFPEQIISRATENNCFWSFWYFFSKLSVVHLVWSHSLVTCPLWKTSWILWIFIYLTKINT